MRTTEMVLFAHFLKTSKFIPACISIYILSLILLDIVNLALVISLNVSLLLISDLLHQLLLGVLIALVL